MIPTIAAILIGTLSPSHPADDLKLLKGAWTPVQWILSGSKVPPPSMRTMKLTLTDGAYEFDEGRGVDSGKLTIRSKKNPKEMDIKGVKGPNAGRTIPAIYQLKDGKLTICYGLDGKRPKEFKSPKKSMVLLLVFSKK